MQTTKKSISVFTDGSCNPVAGIGGWAAIIFVDGEKNILSGNERGSTHQRMELVAAIKAIEYLETLGLADPAISIFTDSQYLVDLQRRKNKMIASSLTTKQNVPVRNADLIKQLLPYLDHLSLKFIKVKSHEKSTGEENYNREADKLSRKIVRNFVRNV